MLLKTALGRPLVQLPSQWAAVKTGNQPVHSLLNPIRHQAAATMSRSQPVDAGLTRSATFLVFSVMPTDGSTQAVRGVLSSLPDITKNISIRDVNANLTCVAGIGSRAWDSLTRLPRPAELHPFPEVRGAKQTAVSTPGDLLFHIRSERRDMCFELERQLVERLGDAVRLEDQTAGFRYFDARDLLGFVDGTANPVGAAVADAVVVSEGPAVGGSYVVVQKYLHDLAAWRALSTEQQEAIIGRTKSDNVELEDAEDGRQQAHKTLATVEDAAGAEHAVLRDNMPFGAPSAGQYGTYFIAYSRHLWVVETMMERMFLGHPPGLHDRILDFSTPVTGTTFFAPSLGSLKALGDEE
uniref:Dyp-type peroxidase n=1 Tax=Ustulina deusta TaxID=110526 RepID=A0A1W5X9X7_9PEZI|nr:dyp-type peroxidase [Ustulina deusta]